MTVLGNLLHNISHRLNRDTLEPQDTKGLERSTEGLPQHQGIFDTCEAWLEPKPEKFQGRINDADRLRYLNIKFTNGVNVLWNARAKNVAITRQTPDGGRASLNQFSGTVEIGKYGNSFSDHMLEISKPNSYGYQRQYIYADKETDLWLQPLSHLSPIGSYSDASYTYTFQPGSSMAKQRYHSGVSFESYDCDPVPFQENENGTISVQDKDGEEVLTPLIPLKLYMNAPAANPYSSDFGGTMLYGERGNI